MPEIIFGNVLGGVNYTSPPGELPIAQAGRRGALFYMSDAQNIVPTLNGYATKRGGSSKLNSAAAYGTNITSIHEFIDSSGSSIKLAAETTKIGKFNSGTNSFDDHITGLTTGLYGQWLNYGDYAIYANGTDNPQKTDGTTGDDLTADESGLTGARWLAEWGERVWTSIGANLIGSALRAPTDFSTSTASIGWWSGYVGNKNDAITGLVPFYDMLLIGKQNQIYVLAGAPETDSSTFRLTPLQTKEKDSIGLTSGRASAIVGNDLLFLDGTTIKRLSGVTQYGDVETFDILYNIKDFFTDSSGGNIDATYLQRADFFHYKAKQQIWVTMPTGAATRYWFVIDYSNPQLRELIGLPKYSVFPMAGLTPLCFCGVTNGYKVDCYAGCTDGFVRQMDTGTNDTSTAISAYATWTVGTDDGHIQPSHVNLNMWYNSACSVTPSYALGLQDWADVRTGGNYTALSAEDLTDSSWITTGGVAQKRIDDFYQNTGRTFTFKLAHSTASQTFEMRQSIMKYRSRFKYYG